MLTDSIWNGKLAYRKDTDKKAAEKAKMTYPINATLEKDPSCQGYEPERVRTTQPQKSPKARR